MGHCLTKEGPIRKLFDCSMRIKEPCVRKFEGFTRSNTPGILETVSLSVAMINVGFILSSHS